MKYPQFPLKELKFISSKDQTLFGSTNYIKRFMDESDSLLHDLHNSRRVGEAYFPAAWDHPDLSVSVSKCRNSGIEMLS
jgi:hypothetical protein